MSLLQIRRRDERLRRQLDEDWADAAARAGERLACRPGCTECCVGPFPITALDARRLREGLGELRQRDPARAAALEFRAADAQRRMSVDFPGDAATGSLDEEDTRHDAFFARHEAVPCPALALETGLCELYEHRPVSCRTYGPPVRIGDEVLPPCRLCFVGASAAEIEACRTAPRVEGEAVLLQEMGDPPETLVAFALGGPPSED